MLLKNLRNAYHRTAGIAKLYAESSEELIDVFQHVSSHIEQVVDYVGADKFFSRFTNDSMPDTLRDHLEELRLNYNRRVSDDAKARSHDTIPADAIPESSRFITTDFAKLDADFANAGPSVPLPRKPKFKPAKTPLTLKAGNVEAGPSTLTNTHHSPEGQEDVDMLAGDAVGTSQPV